MRISRRDALRAGALVAGAAVVTAAGVRAETVAPQSESSPALPPAFDALKPLGDRVKPITTDEYKARIAKAQKLMGDLASAKSGKIDAVFIAPGTTLTYYLGFRWWPSERILALLIPREGDPLLISPAFEEARLREQLRWEIPVRVGKKTTTPTLWQQNGSASRREFARDKSASTKLRRTCSSTACENSPIAHVHERRSDHRGLPRR